MERLIVMREAGIYTELQYWKGFRYNVYEIFLTNWEKYF